MKTTFIALIIAIILASCTIDVRNHDKKSDLAAIADTTKKMYECPMKCETKTYADSGKCPVCEMELIKK